MTHATDQNGKALFSNVKYETVFRDDYKAWGATVWWGWVYATNVRRNYYRTRQEARDAEISDENTIDSKVM